MLDFKQNYPFGLSNFSHFGRAEESKKLFAYVNLGFATTSIDVSVCVNIGTIAGGFDSADDFVDIYRAFLTFASKICLNFLPDNSESASKL